MTSGKLLALSALLPLFASSPATAAVPYAGADADRQAKQALPPSGKALVYVYRSTDKGPSLSPPLHLNARTLGGLAPGTYLYWAVAPGRLELRAGDAPSLSLRIQDGRIYFVRLTVSADGRGELRQVTYGVGRQELHRARLVRETAPPKPETAAAVARSGFNLILKGGSFSLGSTSQDIDAVDSVTGVTQTFRTGFARSAPIYGVEGEWVDASGWTFGGEVLVHNHDYTTEPPGALGRGEMQTVTAVFTTKKYFRTGSVVQPFLGAGLGLASIRLTGQLEGNTIGFAAQAGGGLAFRGAHVGFYTEARYQFAATADVYASGAALLAGVGVQF